MESRRRAPTACAGHVCIGAGLTFAALLTVLVSAPSAPAARSPGSFPAAGEIAWRAVAVRTAPRRSAKVVKILRQFRRDGRLRIVLALRAWRDAKRNLWYKLSLPMRPNGTTGWARASAFRLRPVRARVVIDRSARRLRLYRRGRLVLGGRVAVGAPGMETPIGYFYVTAKFRPRDRVLGRYALETSAYSKLSDWPGGGIVGIHGTFEPWLLGKAVSHGCVRVSNGTVLRLRALAPLGTTIRIVR